MCGYIEVNGEHPSPVIQQPDFAEYLPFFPSGESKVFYPAFGQNASKTIDIIIREKGVLKQVAATWWFDCVDSEQGLVVGHRTTFNARNLTSPFWKHALQNHRAITFATGIGESKLVGKTKHQYYMQGEDVFALGVLYRKHADNKYSCAVITRDSHPKMEPYHDKAFPCFLPMETAFFDIWLDETIQQHPQIDFVLDNPTLYPTLHVQRVKTYKDKVPMKSPAPATLVSDLQISLL
jgi:putative SOS response-associated peptidase YedK